MTNLRKLEFGNKSQKEWIESLALPEQIADNYSRQNAADKNQYREPKRKFPEEKLKWECPVCGVMNFIKPVCTINHMIDFDEHDHDWAILMIMTPRTYNCHNHRCHVKRFYYRDAENVVWARFIGKYEDLDELQFTSRHDPVKFYANLKRHSNPKQTSFL